MIGLNYNPTNWVDTRGKKKNKPSTLKKNCEIISTITQPGLR